MILCVMRLAIGGLAWMAPVCSSTGFPNISKTKRSKSNPDGDCCYAHNQHGNLFATTVAFVLQLCHERKVHWAVENPKGSYIWMTSFLSPTLDYIPHHVCKTVVCACSQGKRKIMEPLTLRCSHSWIMKMQRKCSCKHAHLPTMPANKDGKPCGSPALNKSQGYTPAFGRHVIKYWMAADDSEAVDDSDAISLGPMQKRRRTVNYGDSNAWMLQQDEESDMQQEDKDSDSIDTIDYGGSLDWMQQQDSGDDA